MFDLGWMIDELSSPRGQGNRRARRSLPPPSALRPPHSAFTLIELMITIAIIATLSALFLGASRSAMESAKAARTKITISKLHTLLMEQYATYETRRVDVNKGIVPANSISAVVQDVQLLGLREIMKYEMPDRWSDITEVPQFFQPNSLPAVTRIYRRRFDNAMKTATDNSQTSEEAQNKVLSNENAECLYLVIIYRTGDGEARTLFQDRDIGDTDGDGAPEFLDGWGNPIHWIRWPAGFAFRSEVMTGDPEADHDPLDPFRRNDIEARPLANDYAGLMSTYVAHLRGSDPGREPSVYPVGFRLVPLIFSAGPDGITDIDTSADSTTADPSGNIALDPYAIESSNGSGGYQFGVPEDDPDDPDGEDNSIDNIHNQLIESR